MSDQIVVGGGGQGGGGGGGVHVSTLGSGGSGRTFSRAVTLDVTKALENVSACIRISFSPSDSITAEEARRIGGDLLAAASAAEKIRRDQESF